MLMFSEPMLNALASSIYFIVVIMRPIVEEAVTPPSTCASDDIFSAARFLQE
jgi:hypothetical protein